jgi:hypothetical protein
MRISKQRLKTAQDYNALLVAIKAGFGCLFDKFFNEAPSMLKAQPIK